MAGNRNSGRIKQPANVLQLHGRGDGKDSGGRDIPKPPAFLRVPPEPPSWLHEEAKREWDRVVPGLSRLDILKEEDRAVLTAYCETWAMFREASRSIHDEGLTSVITITRRNGDTEEKPVANPAVAVRNQAGRELRAFAAQFGLTPSSEMALGKVSGDDGGDENPFE